MPRTMSVKRVATTRRGARTGARKPRNTAIIKANTRISGSAIRKILTFNRKARHTDGHEAMASSRLKKESWTAVQPGAEATT